MNSTVYVIRHYSMLCVKLFCQPILSTYSAALLCEIQKVGVVDMATDFGKDASMFVSPGYNPMSNSVFNVTLSTAAPAAKVSTFCAWSHRFCVYHCRQAKWVQKICSACAAFHSESMCMHASPCYLTSFHLTTFPGTLSFPRIPTWCMNTTGLQCRGVCS